MLAKSKYAPIGLDYSLPDLRPLKADRLGSLKAAAEEQGVRCSVRKG